MSAADAFRETLYDAGSCNRLHVESDQIDYAPGEGSEPVIRLVVEVDVELLTVTLDAYHLGELRRALQRAERWLKDSAGRRCGVRVYDAEDNAAEQYPRILPAGVTAQQWVDGVTLSTWWAQRVNVRPRTAAGARSRWARTDRVRIVERDRGCTPTRLTVPSTGGTAGCATESRSRPAPNVTLG